MHHYCHLILKQLLIITEIMMNFFIFRKLVNKKLKLLILLYFIMLFFPKNKKLQIFYIKSTKQILTIILT